MKQRIHVEYRTKLYLAIAFSVTWLGWIGAYFISILTDNTLKMDGTVFDVFINFEPTSAFFIQLIFALAVYGPLAGFLAVKGQKMLFKRDSATPNYWHYVLLVPTVSVLPVFLLSLISGQLTDSGESLVAILLSLAIYFLSNLVTSGTEEFGWRGYLYPILKAKNKTFWDASWKGGLIWALWHYPLLVIMYLPNGIAVLLPSLVGFTASIVAMSYISNFIYEKSKSIWTVVVLHALNNTGSFLIILLFPGSYFSFITSVMSWVIVAYIEKVHKIE